MSNEKIIELQLQIEKLVKEQEYAFLLNDIWLELGPYTPHLSTELRYRMQDLFQFDDSE